MKRLFTLKLNFLVLALTSFLFQANGQSFLVGPVDPYVGTHANYTSHNHYNLFDVMNPDGVILDSITIYPSAAGTPFTIVVQDASQQQVASFSGVSTVGSNLPERIHADILVPPGTGYRLGLTPGSVGMLRNASGIVFPYTVPGVISFTGATFSTTYWYFFYNIRVRLPLYETDAELSRITSPGDTTCSGMQAVSVMMKNNGPADLNSCELHWSINGVAQPVVNWTGSISDGDSATVDLGYFNFQTGTTYSIVANVFEPNGFHDTITHNDTAYGFIEFVQPSPEAAFTSAGSVAICQGDSIELTGTLTGSPPWDFELIAGSTTHQYPGIQTSPFSLNFHPSSSTNYIITTVTDATGCHSVVNDTVEVLVTPQPPAAITPASPTALCEGDSIVLMASVGSGFTYEWFLDGVLIPDVTGFTLIAKEQGDYTVNVISPNGCSRLSDPHQLNVHPIPDVFIGNDTAVLPDVSLLLDAGAGFNTYLWSTGETTRSITVDSSGVGIGLLTVWVEVTDNFSCVGQDEMTINFTPHPGIGGVEQQSSLKLYPNPSDGFISMESIGLPPGKYLLKVTTQHGQQVYQREIAIGLSQEPHHFDLSHLANGIYFLQVQGAAGTASHQLLINR